MRNDPSIWMLLAALLGAPFFVEWPTPKWLTRRRQRKIVEKYRK